MSLRTLEAAILAEARTVTKRPKLRQKDIREWSTGEITPEAGEVTHFLPVLRVYVAVLVEEPKGN